MAKAKTKTVTAASVDKLNTIEKIMTCIETAEKHVKNGRNAYQKAAIAALKHVAEHGDIFVLRRLISGMIEGDVVQVNKMTTFFEKFGPVRIEELDDSAPLGDGLAKAKFQLHYDNSKKLDLYGALNTWWNTTKGQAQVTAVTDYEVIMNDITRLAKRADNPKPGDHIRVQFLRDLQDFIDDYDFARLPDAGEAANAA